MDSVYHGKEDDLDFTDYSELVYMEQCIKETLRYCQQTTFKKDTSQYLNPHFYCT